MKRLLPCLLALMLIAAPISAFAQFGPIVPDVCKACACGFGGVLAIIQNLINFVIALSIIIATIIIAWAGGLYMLSATNPESRSQANKMLINAVVGIMIVLSAWLIVDFVMKTLYGGQFGPWNSILIGGTGENCIQKKDTVPLFSGPVFAVPGKGADDADDSGSSGGTGANCPVPAESTMVSIPSEALAGGSGKATRDTVENFMAMRAAAKKDGVDLKVTSAYRSDAAQVSLWNSLGKDTSKVAKPCSLGGGGSNHNSGKALDIAVGCSNGNSSCNTKTYQWLKANGGKWNFRNALQDDPVHWSPSGR